MKEVLESRDNERQLKDNGMPFNAMDTLVPE